MDNVPAFLGGIFAVILVVAHGGIGHFWSSAQLRDVRLRPTLIVGDEVIAHRMFTVVWHIVTVTFAASATVLFMTAFGELDNRALLRFVAVAHALFAAAAGAVCATRLDAFLHPIPAVAGISMSGVTIFAWIAS